MAFAYSGLTSLELSESVEYISETAFYSTNNLQCVRTSCQQQGEEMFQKPKCKSYDVEVENILKFSTKWIIIVVVISFAIVIAAAYCLQYFMLPLLQMLSKNFQTAPIVFRDSDRQRERSIRDIVLAAQALLPVSFHLFSYFNYANDSVLL